MIYVGTNGVWKTFKYNNKHFIRSNKNGGWYLGGLDVEGYGLLTDKEFVWYVHTPMILSGCIYVGMCYMISLADNKNI